MSFHLNRQPSSISLNHELIKSTTILRPEPPNILSALQNMHFTSATAIALVSALTLSSAAVVERKNWDGVFCGAYDLTNPTADDARDAVRGLPQGD